MAPSVGPAASIRPGPWRWLLIAVVVVIGVWLGALLPRPWGVDEHDLLVVLRVPALVLAALLAAFWTVWIGLRARSPHPLPAAATPAPLLAPPHLMACRSRSPVVVLAGVEPGAGVSTVTFNLALSLIAYGHARGEEASRRLRPACLLAEGTLATALGLDPGPLEEYLAEHPYRVGPEVVDLAARHASGCELFCLAGEGRAYECLRLLVPELRRRYDALLIDGGSGGHHVVDLAGDVGDALLLVALPTAAAVDSAAFWIERVWALGLEQRTGLLLNRVAARPPPPSELILAFLHHAQLPEEPRVLALNQEGLPWSLDGRLRAAQRLSAIARQMFPTLMPEADLHAA